MKRSKDWKSIKIVGFCCIYCRIPVSSCIWSFCFVCHCPTARPSRTILGKRENDSSTQLLGHIVDLNGNRSWAWPWQPIINSQILPWNTESFPNTLTWSIARHSSSLFKGALLSQVRAYASLAKAWAANGRSCCSWIVVEAGMNMKPTSNRFIHRPKEPFHKLHECPTRWMISFISMKMS